MRIWTKVAHYFKIENSSGVFLEANNGFPIVSIYIMPSHKSGRNWVIRGNLLVLLLFDRIWFVLPLRTATIHRPERNQSIVSLLGAIRLNRQLSFEVFVSCLQIRALGTHYLEIKDLLGISMLETNDGPFMITVNFKFSLKRRSNGVFLCHLLVTLLKIFRFRLT